VNRPPDDGAVAHSLSDFRKPDRVGAAGDDTTVKPAQEAQEARTRRDGPEDGCDSTGAPAGARARLRPRSCEACGAQFTPGRAEQRYCRDACRAQASRARQNAAHEARLAALEDALSTVIEVASAALAAARRDLTR
jgi:hypothetical protein